MSPGERGREYSVDWVESFFSFPSPYITRGRFFVHNPGVLLYLIDDASCLFSDSVTHDLTRPGPLGSKSNVVWSRPLLDSSHSSLVTFPVGNRPLSSLRYRTLL